VDVSFLVNHFIELTPFRDDENYISTTLIGNTPCAYYRSFTNTSTLVTVFTQDWIIAPAPIEDTLDDSTKWVYLGGEYYFKGNAEQFENDMIVFRLVLQ
jgi:hypothetical protein